MRRRRTRARDRYRRMIERSLRQEIGKQFSSLRSIGAAGFTWIEPKKILLWTLAERLPERSRRAIRDREAVILMETVIPRSVGFELDFGTVELDGVPCNLLVEALVLQGGTVVFVQPPDRRTISRPMPRANSPEAL